MSFTPQKDVVLTSMPFSNLNMPSMALSLLKACLTRAGIESVVQNEYLYFIKRFGLKEYMDVQLSRGDFLVGEMIFATTAHGKTLLTAEDFCDWLVNKRIFAGDETFRTIAKVHELAADIARWQEDAKIFIEQAAARVMAYKPKIVALASMFQQVNANIALARRLKQEKNPPLILIGGANCMGEAGFALIEHVEAFDYVFLGEADEIFADVCKTLIRDGFIAPEKLPYGVISRQSPKSKTLIHRVTKNLDGLPVPDFSDYLTTYKKLFPESNEAHLLVEGSRGCWWAAHKPCTFCGLNGFALGYREKSTERLADEIKSLNETYPDAKVCVFTDSILSRIHTRELPAALKNRNVTLKFFSEIKANVTEDEIASLAEAGFVQLQPGIESLQDDVLRMMNKGCRAIKQVETLKICRTYNVLLSWNLLCGFPDEREEYMAQIVELIPLIMHLENPNQIIHIVYHRYGEYTENPERYGLSIRPSKAYDFAFDDRDFINRTSYVFEPTDDAELAKYYGCQRMGDAYAKAQQLIKIWFNERFNPQRLDMNDTGDAINIFDMRNVSVHAAYNLTGLTAQLYRACRSVKSESTLIKMFPDVPTEKIRAELDKLCADKIMLNIGNEYLALAVDANPRFKNTFQRRRFVI